MIGAVGAKTTGIVLDVANQRGGAMPSVVTLHDWSRFGNDGAMANITWGQEPSRLWVMGFNGATSLSNHGDCVLARTVEFWMNPDSLTESILEETAAVGISINAGAMVYGSWDNCYVDGIDTDAIISAVWKHIVITSTTDVVVSAFRLGLIAAAYFDGEMAMVRLYRYALTPAAIRARYTATKRLFGK